MVWTVPCRPLFWMLGPSLQHYFVVCGAFGAGLVEMGNVGAGL